MQRNKAAVKRNPGRVIFDSGSDLFLNDCSALCAYLIPGLRCDQVRAGDTFFGSLIDRFITSSWTVYA